MVIPTASPFWKGGLRGIFLIQPEVIENLLFSPLCIFTIQASSFWGGSWLFCLLASAFYFFETFTVRRFPFTEDKRPVCRRKGKEHRAWGIERRAKSRGRKTVNSERSTNNTTENGKRWTLFFMGGWHKKRAFFPIPVCFLEGFHETPSFFVAQIIDAVSQDCNRNFPLHVDREFISAETGNNTFNDFTLKKGKEHHGFFFRRIFFWALRLQ